TLPETQSPHTPTAAPPRASHDVPPEHFAHPPFEEPGTRGEEAGHESREIVDTELVRRASALEYEARQPERHIERRVSDARVIPVEEHRTPIAQTEIVAPRVAMAGQVSAKRRGLGRR